MAGSTVAPPGCGTCRPGWWTDLQGACLPAYTFVLRTYAANPAEMRLRCTGTDYRMWYKHRYSSGAWTGWNPE